MDTLVCGIGHVCSHESRLNGCSRNERVYCLFVILSYYDSNLSVCQPVLWKFPLRLTSFSISTAMKTTEDVASVTASSAGVSGSVLKMGFRNGT